MVATRLTLLSLAALSSCMFGAVRGAPRVGRLERRLSATSGGVLRNTTAGPSAASSSSSSSSVPSLSGSDPVSSPGGSSSTQLASQQQCLTCSTSASTAPSALPSSSTDTTTAGVQSETHYQAFATATGAAESAFTPAAPPPLPTGRKAPPPIPSRPTNGAQGMVTISVDYSRSQKPAADSSTTTTSLPGSAVNGPRPDPAWPPTRDDFSVEVPPSVLADWFSTRASGPTWNWGDATTTVEEISTWSQVSWISGWVTVGDVTPSQTVSYCQQSDYVKPSTVYVITHTTTITWTGDPRSYTPPFPPISTPTPCVTPSVDESKGGGPHRMTLSRCTSTGSDATYRTCEVTTVYSMSERPKTSIAGMDPISALPSLAIVTFITTDKNPAVVFPGISTPDYGVEGSTKINVKEPPGKVPADQTPAAVDNNNVPGSASTTPSPLGPPVTVSVRPGAVVINDQIFSDSPVMPTQVVRVNGELFTINPSEVVGAGATVVRPGGGGTAPGAGGGATPTGGAFIPSTTSVGGVPVYVSGRVAVVEGTTFSLDAPAGPATKVVGDKTVSIGPDGIAVATGGGSGAEPARLTPPPPGPGGPQHTEVVVAGGELVTAVGRSVFVVRSTTITYGPNIPETTVMVNGEPVVVGPAGISMHGTVIGGPSARETDSQYEIVGGATITQIGPSLVVIQGSTYTVGPGATATTVVVGNQTVTLGPTGVAVSSLSFFYPLGPAMATTITPGATAAAATANPTSSNSSGGGGSNSGGGGGNGGGGDSKKDTAAVLRPGNLMFNLVVSCCVVFLSLWWV